MRYLGRFERTRDPRKAKAALVAFIDAQVERTDAFLADLDRIGAPAVEGGPAFQATLERGFEGFREVALRAQVSARALPVRDRHTLDRRFRSLWSEFQQGLTDIGRRFDGLAGHAELNKAMAREPTCRIP